MTFVRLADRQIEYRIFTPSGHAPAAPAPVAQPTRATGRPRIVLLHEGLGCVALWRQFPQTLADRLGEPVLAYSRYGYGQSDVLEAPRPVQFMHDEADRPLRELREHFGIESPILIGHSDGASIALLHAGLFAGSVAAVVAMAPHLFVEEFGLRSIRQARADFDTTDLPAKLGRYHRDARKTFDGWCDVWLSEAFLRWNIEAEVAHITAPVLAIQGLDDQYGTMRQIERIAELVPGTRLLKLPDCRHSPHLERAEATTQAIAGFVAALGEGHEIL